MTSTETWSRPRIRRERSPPSPTRTPPRRRRRASPTSIPSRSRSRKPAGQAVTLTNQYEWDERFGTTIGETDPNQRVISKVLDGLGRVSEILSTPPDNPAGTPVVLTDFFFALGG